MFCSCWLSKPTVNKTTPIEWVHQCNCIDRICYEYAMMQHNESWAYAGNMTLKAKKGFKVTLLLVATEVSVPSNKLKTRAWMDRSVTIQFVTVILKQLECSHCNSWIQMGCFLDHQMNCLRISVKFSTHIVTPNALPLTSTSPSSLAHASNLGPSDWSPWNIDFPQQLPSRELTYPTLGKGKSSSKCHFLRIC